VVRNQYAPPSSNSRNSEPGRRHWAPIVLVVLAVAIVLPIALFIARETWRARALLALCKAAQPGITITELLALEKHHLIDDSYLVQANFEGYIDQASSHALEFRSHMLDPEFACAIGHDGKTVRNVELLGLEGAEQS
jgi:hypothetical protein